MLVLGVDPGIHRIGWGLVKEEGSSLYPIAYACLETNSKNTTPERLAKIYKELSLIITKYNPDVISLEDLFFSKNTKTAMVVSQARGVIMLACQHHKCVLVEHTPLQIKMALTGYGRASKQQIQQMVKSLLRLKEVPKPDDTADGLAAAICAIYSKNKIRPNM